MRLEFASLAELDALLARYEFPRKRIVSFEYDVKLPSGERYTARGVTMQDLTVGKTIDVTMGPAKDQFGNDAPVDGAYAFEALDPNVTVTPTADGMGFSVKAGTVAVGPIDAVKISADVDMGSGVTTVEEVWQINVHSGQAAVFSPVAGPEHD